MKTFIPLRRTLITCAALLAAIALPMTAPTAQAAKKAAPKAAAKAKKPAPPPTPACLMAMPHLVDPAADMPMGHGMGMGMGGGMGMGHHRGLWRDKGAQSLCQHLVDAQKTCPKGKTCPAFDMARRETLDRMIEMFKRRLQAMHAKDPARKMMEEHLRWMQQQKNPVPKGLK